MTQMIVLPPRAKVFIRETHWMHDVLSNPLDKDKVKNTKKKENR